VHEDQKMLQELAGTIRGIVLDVDGVLTDGKIIYGSDGSEHKHFHVQDGGSLKLLSAQGIAIAIITGRQSSVVQRRADELGITYVSQGADNKAGGVRSANYPGVPKHQPVRHRRRRSGLPVIQSSCGHSDGDGR
jgi:hypothetical protein